MSSSMADVKTNRPRPLRRSRSLSQISVKEAEEENQSRKLSKYLRDRKQIIVSVLLVFLWLHIGAFFYGYHNDWPYTAALYFSAQAGLSIGFGALAENDDISRAFTVYHILAGSSFIAGAVGVFVTNTMEKHVVDWESQRLAAMKNATDKKTQEELANHKGPSWWDDNKTGINCAVAFIVWVCGVGVFYGMYWEDWDFITSLYFSIVACSTGGLQAPNVDLSSNNWRLIYVTVYIIIGVPVYGMVLGQFANLTINDYMARKTKQKINKHLDESQMKFAMCFNGHDDNVIQWETFVCFSLIRLGLCDMDLLDDIKHHFEELDVDGSGYLGRNELVAAMEFGRYDVDRNGVLQPTDFRLVYDKIVQGRFKNIEVLNHPQAVDRCFEDIDDDNDENVTRREFQVFFNFLSSEEAVTWFSENGEAWLTGSKSLPLDTTPVVHISLGNDTGHSAMEKNTKMQQSELRHFYLWSEGKEGTQWMETNQLDFNAGEIDLPSEAFLFEHLARKNKESGVSLEMPSGPVQVTQHKTKDSEPLSGDWEKMETQ